MRRRRRSQGHLAAVAGPLSDARPPAAEEAGHEVLYQLIDQLPPSWKDALHMRVMGGLSYLEISRALHCTPAQVRTWLYRARRQLADQLRSRDGLNEAGVNHVRLS
jgi:RNA polymerase sigma factor (sigma-70 family)